MKALLWAFFKIGAFTYGGGLAMIPLLRDIAINMQWMDNAQFANLIAIAQSTPGPIAINMATFIGYQQQGVLGALFSSISVILPAFIMALIVAKFLKHFNDQPVVKAMMIALRAAVMGLLLTATLQVALVSLYEGQGQLSNLTIGLDYKAIVFFGAFCGAFIDTRNILLFISSLRG